jgi:SPP1 gp7 family putative phage head morphogenesis protein
MPNLFDENQKLSHRLQGIFNAIGDEIAEVLEESLDRITGLTMLAEERARTAKSLIRRKQYLLRQQKEIQKILDSIYQDIGKTIKGKAVEVGQAAPAIANDILKTVIPKSFKISMNVPTISKKQVIFWFDSAQVEGLYFNQWLTKLSSNTTARIIRESRLALLAHEGRGPRKIAAKRIQEALGVSRKSATGLATNAITQAQAYGQRQFDIENKERLKGLRWVSQLDRRTCPKCSPLDQQVFKIDDCPLPPIHWLCRCYTEPVFKNAKLEKYLGEQTRIARMDTKARTVHHRDGTTSTKFEKLRVKFPKRKLNYNQWMQSMVKSKNLKDVAFAREALGPTRFKLVASGKLKMQSLYYAGKLRTIKELQKLMRG